MKISKLVIRQSLACIPAVFIQFLVGIGWGWTAPTLHKLQNGHHSDFVLTSDQASLLGAISEGGRIFGPFVSPLLMDNIGRKSTLVLVSLLYVFVWTLVIFFPNFYVVLVSRFLFGMGNGMNDVASTVYTSEICTPLFRGLSGSATILSFFMGHIFETFIATYLSYTNVAIVNTVIAIAAIGSTYCGVETTYYLTMKGKDEKARKSLVWSQPGRNDYDEEIKKIQKNVAEEKEKRQSIKILFTDKNNLTAIFAAVVWGILHSAVGYHTLMPFASLIFRPSESFTPNEFTIMFSASQFVTSIVACFVIEKINRRPLFILSFSLMFVTNICISLLLYVQGRHFDIEGYPWFLFISITTHMVIYTLILPAAYITASEVLPLSVRAIGGSMAVTFQSIASFTTAVLFFPITETLGMESNFIMYAVNCAVTVLFVYKILPETRGKALHNMYEKTDVVNLELSS